MTTDVIRHEEEWANALTHAAGLALGVVGGATVIVRAVQYGNALQVAACILYAVTLLATYAASTLSHVFSSPTRRHVFRVADQAVIYLYIAASWTPMAVTWMHDGAWWILHGFLWVVGLVGFTQKAFFSHRVHFGSVSIGLYVLQGFLPLVALQPMIKTLPIGLLAWLLAGGLFFATGLIFFRLDHRVRYFHALWHLLVIAGSTCHYLGVLLYCTAAR